jgi:hypothetical protein
MKITFKRTYGEYIVTIDGRYYSFNTCKDACEFILSLRKAA